MDGEGNSQLIEWTPSFWINKNGTNVLRVVTQGSLITIYVNGQVVNQVEDGSLTSGYVGLFVASLQEIAFDNLMVKEELQGEPLLKAAMTSTIGGTKPGRPFIPGEIHLHR